MNKTKLAPKFTKGLHLLVITALLMAALAVAPVPVAHAATINVAAGEVAVIDNDTCSLREAIINANDGAQTHDDCEAGSGGADTINLAAGSTYTLTDAPGAYDADGPNGLPDITSQVTINGNGATIQRSSAGGTPDFRIFHVAAGGDLTLDDVTITNGKTPDGTGGGHGGSGGGIYNQGTLTLTDSTVSGNWTGDGGACDGYKCDGGYGGDGGGIRNSGGTVEITDSTVSGNNTGDGGACDGEECDGGYGGSGGGIYNDEGTLDITDSTVSGNSTGDGGACTGDWCKGGDGGSGGGVFTVNYSSGSTTITDSTLSGNRTGDGGACDGGGLVSSQSSPTLTNVTISGNAAAGYGGGIKHVGIGGYTLTLTNCTITDNTADSDNDGDGDGGGIYGHSGTVNLKNTILAGNTDPTSAPDCSGTLASQDYNLVGDNSGCTFTPQTHDQVGTGGSPVDPQLGPLADNGGPTETHALLTGSPAINAIPEGGTGYNGAPAMDQRGVTRPQPAAGDCDVGAYEAGPPILRVSKAGSGDGTVTSDVAGINCGADCAEWYDKDTVVTLTATPDVGFVFAGWSGNADCSDGQVTMDADKTCIATFNEAPGPGPVPVGGVIVPVNKLELLAPWMGLAALASLAALTVALVRRRRSA